MHTAVSLRRDTVPSSMMPRLHAWCRKALSAAPALRNCISARCR
jgi:hypothetical protein